MLSPAHPLMRLVREDRRYPLQAYLFVFDALSYAQSVLGLGAESDSDEPEPPPSGRRGQQQERHVTGQQLCEAIRAYALEQFGAMAKCVLNNWGIYRTSDFGEIVYNLIRIKQMRKTRQDRREDFDDVYDFDEAFSPQHYRIKLPK